MRLKLYLSLYMLLICAVCADAQTACSLFWRSDSLQVNEIVSPTGCLTGEIGHHGPAVENSHMALRLAFDDSGAVDVYSKSGRGMELERYFWYPTDSQQQEQGAGCDAYEPGETLGLGGIALWDGENVVRLAATKGRTARTGAVKNGSYLEVISYGVIYKGEPVDISVRIEVTVKSRAAKITAMELSGKKVQFVTGINWHEGQHVAFDGSHVCVWGVHPCENEKELRIGAGMFYSDKIFPQIEKTEDMVRLISRLTDKVSTSVVAASTMEAELNSLKRFETYMKK